MWIFLLDEVNKGLGMVRILGLRIFRKEICGVSWIFRVRVESK